MFRLPETTQRFVGQFLLARTPAAVPPSWSVEGIEGWFLHRGDGLPASPLLDARSDPIGWVIGWPIGDSGPMRPAAFQVGAAATDPELSRHCEALLATVAGRYVAVVVAPGLQRVYLDAAGLLGAVFNPSEQVVASSLHLARCVRSPDAELIEALQIPARDHFYPFGLTPDLEVRRLVPNHFLDLSDFAVRRHWPSERDRPSRTASDPLQGVREIADRLKRTMAALAEAGPLVVCLTAGRDSRVILGACRARVSSTQFVTIAHDDAGGRLDCRVATILARRFSLRHQVVAWLPPSARDLQEWQDLTGECVAGRTWREVRTVQQLPPSTFCVQGLCAEVGRAYYWREDDVRDAPISGQALVRRLRLPTHPRLVQEADAWRSDLPVTERPDVLDLLYIEQRLGCWAGPSLYGHPRIPRISPFSDSRIFRLMMGLPPEYRSRQQLTDDLLKELWPELLAVPFNRVPGAPGVVGGLRRRMKAYRAKLGRLARPRAGDGTTSAR